MKEITEQTAAALADAMREFLRLEAAGGVLLLGAAIVAIVWANSPFAPAYESLFATPISVRIGELSIDKPLVLWVNDGLMAVFFFLIGLEIKRELVEGELSSPAQVALPGIAALGGIAVPALMYASLNTGDAEALEGWAIPVATDIAFALGLLSAFGSRVPTPLKVFLLSLAIFDDLAAIVIIAVFYTGNLSWLALGVASIAVACAVAMNLAGVVRISAYMLVAVVAWVAVLKSGVHATLAGVAIAFCIPLRDAGSGSPARTLEHDLHGPVAFVILPLFAFANAGLALSGTGLEALAHPVTLGIVAGLLLGKPLGVTIFVGLALLLRIARLPHGVTWPQLLGVAFACGIGFTMSLFIAGLAFENAGVALGGDKLGVLIGSLASAGVAAFVLHMTLPRRS
jgi:NhaA family Na+:H+ antiporter